MKQKRIFALGFFDGVHLGHQALLAECVRRARMIGAQPAAITFDQHPKALYTQNHPMLINTLEDRKRLLQHYQIEHIHVVPVNEDTMNKPWRTFLDELVADGAVGFVCGDDFHFGHKGIGHAGKLEAYCQEHGFHCKIIQEQTLGRIRISSTRVRSLVAAGEMETAALFLGHPHIFSGKVVPGRHLGRTIGVPTANILIPPGMVIPRMGVYVTSCQLGDKTYAAVTNIGSRPTVEGHQLRTETWLLDYEGDLYDTTITLQFHHFLRPEKKFLSLEYLRAQIDRDAAAARRKLDLGVIR